LLLPAPLAATKVAGILEAVHSLLARQIGIVSVCDVEVIRQEHF
jgi:hypothetical protein